MLILPVPTIPAVTAAWEKEQVNSQGAIKTRILYSVKTGTDTFYGSYTYNKKWSIQIVLAFTLTAKVYFETSLDSSYIHQKP